MVVPLLHCCMEVVYCGVEVQAGEGVHILCRAEGHELNEVEMWVVRGDAGACIAFG